MELTKEYFDKALENLMGGMATQESVDRLEAKMATKDDLAKLEAKMASKVDLIAQTKELKQYTTDAFEVQQHWMDERFKELIVKYDVRERVEKLEKDVLQLQFGAKASL